MLEPASKSSSPSGQTHPVVPAALDLSVLNLSAGIPKSSVARDPDAREVADELTARLAACRHRSVALTASLTVEDQVAQASVEASPIKWHLAHTTWFFEAFVLKPFLSSYKPFSDQFDYCFNSYYESLGERLSRDRRGLLTRPSLEDVHLYRAHVNAGLLQLDQEILQANTCLRPLLELGIAHEQQHQELMLTDILALFAAQPLLPAYGSEATHNLSAATHTSAISVGDRSEVEQSEINRSEVEHSEVSCCKLPGEMLEFSGCITKTGHKCEDGFAFDNESPEHDALLQPFRIATNLVTNAQWIEFINDDGYRNASHWLSDGWQWAQSNRIGAPGYWHWTDSGWQQMTLLGRIPVNPNAPVGHVSFYEADAFAKWAGKRLPTEFEWEHAAKECGWTVNHLDTAVHKLIPSPLEATQRCKLKQAFGDLWQWTSSAYLPYPGYRPPESAIGEYNGKFMCSQMVLRGSSFATPPGHTRVTYRNFFYPHQRWQFTGLRLAEDVR